MNIVLSIGALAMFLLFCLGIRNELVFMERMRVLNIISKMATQAIANNDPEWKRFYEIIDRFTYDEMLWKFWRPIKSFYRDLARGLDA